MKRITAILVMAAGSAFAQSNSMTATSTEQPYIGSAPIMGFVSATVTSTTTPVAATLPTSTNSISSVLCGVRDSSGNPKAAQVTVSSTTSRLVLATSNQNSSTIAVGDVLNCTIHYRR